MEKIPKVNRRKNCGTDVRDLAAGSAAPLLELTVILSAEVNPRDGCLLAV